MAFNLNTAKKQGDFAIPDGIYRLKARLRPGGAGEDGLLRLAKNLRTQMLDLECTIVADAEGAGEYDGLRVWDLITVYADLSNDPDNNQMMAINADEARRYKIAVKMGLAKLKALVESAHEVNPDDDSEAARRIREFESISIVDGLEFWAELVTQKGTNGNRDKVCIDRIVVPGDADWPSGKSGGQNATVPTPPPSPLDSPEALAKAMGRDGLDDDEIPF